MEPDVYPFADDLSPARIFSLSEVALAIRELLRQSFSGELWVKSEIAKLNIHQQSGHCYLDLVEKQNSQTKAQFRAVIWANDFEYISDKFSRVTHTALKSGMMVLFMVRPVFHAVYGLSLQIADVEPSFTLGEMERQRRETIGKLNREGIFNSNKALAFPPIPLRLAVISAFTSKGYADFLNILNNYPRRYRFDIQLFPALLQGDKAVESIRTQLRFVEKQHLDFDLVLIIRGGGDEIGMTCFDDYSLSRDVCVHPLPVVTGIGHATNLTIVEMVAARNKITPTDVAYEILGVLDGIFSKLKESEQKVGELASGVLRNGESALLVMAKQLSALMHGTIIRENIRLGQKGELLTLYPGRIIKNRQGALMMGFENISRRSRRLMNNNMENLDTIERQVSLLDPVNILKRGFSMTFRADGSLVTSHREVAPGERITSRLRDGVLHSKLENGEPEEQR